MSSREVDEGTDDTVFDEWSDLDEDYQPKSSHRRRTRTRSAPTVAFGRTASELQVLGIASLAAVSGALAPGEPTGWAPIDLVMRAGVAFAVAWLTPRARRWTWLLMTGAAALSATDLVSGVLAWSALALAFWSTLTSSRQRWLGALIGGLAVSALLRLPDLAWHGTTALITAVAITPVFLSAYSRERRSRRRRIRRVAYVVAGVVALASIGFVIAGLASMASLREAVEDAKAGLQAAKDGDEQQGRARLDVAAEKFDTATRRFDAWYARPARAVPILGHQANAASTMARLGGELSHLASDTVRDADYRGISFQDGRVDVAKIRTLQAPLHEIDRQLRRANDSTGTLEVDWLVAPLHERYDRLVEELHEAASESETAVVAVDAAPELLGASGRRRYLVAFITPAEARGAGGFMGNWAELTADNGKLELTASGRQADLRVETPTVALDMTDDYRQRYALMHPEAMPGDVTLSPDFPSVSRTLTAIYQVSKGGPPVDGVLSLDPYALAGMLRFTGPIAITGHAEPLTADNAAEYLLRNQYLDFDTKQQRVDALDEVSQKTFDAFLHTKSIRLSDLSRTFGPLVEEGRIHAATKIAAAQTLVDRLGMDGAFRASLPGDFFALVTQNAGNNKIDVYLRRRIDYRASFQPDTGDLDVNMTVTLQNQAPSTGLPDYVIKNRDDSGQPRGTNWVWMNLYSPHDLVSMTNGNEPVLHGAAEELGMHVYAAHVAVPSGGETQIRIHLRGHIDPMPAYRVSWWQQPVVSPDEVSVAVIPSPPWVPQSEEGQLPAGSGGAMRKVESRRSGQMTFQLVEP